MLLLMAPTLEVNPLGSRPWSLGLCLAAALALIPPAGAVAAEQAIRASYRCLGRFDAVDVTAFFFNRAPAELVLLLGETATRLPQARAADGALYASGDRSFRLRGETASWSFGRAPAMVCQVRPVTPSR